jgi:hypothetical protein
MRLWFVVTLLVGSVLAVSARAQNLTTVEPLSAKVGDTVSAKGEGIDKAAVDTLTLYLTDGTNDFKCEMIEQTGTGITSNSPCLNRTNMWYGKCFALKSIYGDGDAEKATEAGGTLVWQRVAHSTGPSVLQAAQ